MVKPYRTENLPKAPSSGRKKTILGYFFLLWSEEGPFFSPIKWTPAVVGTYYGILITLESLSISIPFLVKWGWDVCSCKQKIGKKRDISYTSYQNNIIWSDTCEITFFLHAEKRKLFFGQTKTRQTKTNVFSSLNFFVSINLLF